MTKTLLLSLLGLLFATQGHANDAYGIIVPKRPIEYQLHPLVTITNDRDSRNNTLFLMTDSAQRVSGLYSETLGIPTALRHVFDRSLLESDYGAVLEEQSSCDIFVVKGRFSDSEEQARLDIRFLKNGLLKTYDSCRVSLRRDKHGQWGLFRPDGHLIKKLHILSWAMGVSSVEGLCSKK